MTTSPGTIKLVIFALIIVFVTSLVGVVTIFLMMPKDASPVLAATVVTGLLTIATGSAGAISAILANTHSNPAGSAATTTTTQTVTPPAATGSLQAPTQGITTNVP